ncbi:prolyl aminopeptidase-like protein [Xylariomycetidae sp. FL2044]|nr:prolyl aminopeptidase-like protein [Xylariomycetidae sp. FL2044]
MEFPFEVTEHTMPAQHVREWPRATGTSQEAVLQIHIKQYRPKDNLDPQPSDVTIIGAHGNAFPKEVYEPIWCDLYTQSRARGFRIRGIWIADVAHQGYSYMLNEQLLGNDPGWSDHARDLLHMVNVFRSEMPRPIIGIAHSFGGNILTQLALMHPRLLSALILYDPVINMFSHVQTGAINGARLAAARRDAWPSREAAVTSFRRSRFFSTWDPRVLQAWIDHALRDAPKGEVTLATPRHQEAFTYFRPLYPYERADGTVDREGAPDFDAAFNDPPDVRRHFPFYRSEGHLVVERLPNVRPSVLWVFGGTSDITLPPSSRSEMAQACGSGCNGSGGVAAGRVAEIHVEGRGHLFPLEIPGVCAEHAAKWIQRDMEHYCKTERDYADWARRPLVEKTTLSRDHIAALGNLPSMKQSTDNKQSKL